MTNKDMLAVQLPPTYLMLHRVAYPCLAYTVRVALHPREQWKCSRPREANDVSQYGGSTNRRVALAGAMGDVNNNLNPACSNEVECLAVS